MTSEIKDIYEDLEAQGISIQSVHRIYSLRGPKRQLPLFLVKVLRGDNRIYKVTRWLDLIVLVEKQRERSMPGHHEDVLKNVVAIFGDVRC